MQCEYKLYSKTLSLLFRLPEIIPFLIAFGRFHSVSVRGRSVQCVDCGNRIKKLICSHISHNYIQHPPRAPGVAAADYVTTSSSLPGYILSKTPQLKSPTKSVVGLCSGHIMFRVISARNFSCYVQCLRCVVIFGFPPIVYPSKNWGGCCSAVPTDDAVATGEVYCHNCIVRFRSLPGLTDDWLGVYQCSATTHGLR